MADYSLAGVGRSSGGTSRLLAVVRRWRTIVGWDVVPLRREPAHPAEQPAEHLLKLLRTPEVVLDALEHPSHQLLELRILGELLLQATQLGHELFHLDFLRHLHEHRLGGRGGDHLHLLADHLESLAGHARPLVLTAAELRLELVQLRMDAAEIDPGCEVVAHEVIVEETRVPTAEVHRPPDRV
jgi:hypothetical protein